jgi:hypothetical protein
MSKAHPNSRNMQEQNLIEANKRRLIEAYDVKNAPSPDFENQLIDKLNRKLDGEPLAHRVFDFSLISAAASVALLLGFFAFSANRDHTKHGVWDVTLPEQSNVLLAADDLFGYHLFEVMDLVSQDSEVEYYEFYDAYVDQEFEEYFDS